MTNLAFLGTGLIGGALAEAAARRGDTVTAWNRTAAKAEALRAFGARVAATPAEAIAGADRIHLALPDDAAVDAVLAACGGGLAGKLVIDHSTAAPAGTAARAALLAARGVRFLSAPVFMSPQMCRTAGGMMLVAGPRAVFDQAQPALAKMTGTVDYLGERPDLAAAFKLFGNAMILSVAAGLADVYAMAKGLGIGAPEAHALFSKFNPAGVIAYRGLAMSKGDYRASFELTMARKDARLMIETAGGAPLSVLPAVAARMDQLIARGLGADDLGVLAVDAVAKAQ
jgi:3-hydroxyisobutyrate dehydrogenase-like beta-hydroxyacid dehydrogenase